MAGNSDLTSIVVVPTYNESENIERLIHSVLHLDFAPDILIIDDGSPDGTADIIKAKQKDAEMGSRIHLIEREGKQGLGTAYIHGFHWALENRYEWICQMDADFSHDPKMLEQFIAKLSAGETDVVIGTRYMKGGGTEGWAMHRNLLSRMANIYARFVTRVPLKDLTGGFKAYQRKALESLNLNEVSSEGYAFQIELTTKIYRNGFRCIEIPILFRERERGVSKISRNVVWEAIFVVLRLGLRR